MKLSELKTILQGKETLAFEMPNGQLVPSHFHITEVGKAEKTFIDCGGTLRNDSKVILQLWEANDYDHRLHPNKLLQIIALSEEKLNIPNAEIEVEYQGSTIGKYGLDYSGEKFILTSTTTDCLAKDKCGITKEKVALSSLQEVEQAETSNENSSCCSPESGCC